MGAAVQSPSVIVTAGNCLLVKAPCFAYLTGDPAANRIIVPVSLELKCGEVRQSTATRAWVAEYLRASAPCLSLCCV